MTAVIAVYLYKWTGLIVYDIMKAKVTKLHGFHFPLFDPGAVYVRMARIMTHQDICMAWPTAGCQSGISSGQACTTHWSWRSDCSPRCWWCLSRGKPSYSTPRSPPCLSCRWPSCRCPTPTCRSWRGTCCGTVCLPALPPRGTAGQPGARNVGLHRWSAI